MSIDDSIARVEYRPAVGFPGYWVGDDGTAWCAHNSHRRPNKTGVWIDAAGALCRQITGTVTRRGYIRVLIQRGPGIGASKFVHHLVLEAFVGPCPPGMECRHLDGQKTNNRLDNVCWGTPTENSADKTRHGTQNGHGEGRVEFVSRVKVAFAEGATAQEVAERFGIARAVANAIYGGHSGKHVPWPKGFKPKRRRVHVGEEGAARIRLLSALGFSGRWISGQVGVSYDMVIKILRGEYY